ncbi:quinoprotein relay system zinc metallohydrolase 2 [Antarctobacter sp.]|uniref:quinoprotein relay system zinc metallohydrolase 2 n=1 Tax=Antarctobacter sp. TaxID=1872577 RepID=UPI003A8D047F
MFEAVVMLCAGLDGAPCRAALLPGYEAADLTRCEAALSASPPDLSAFGVPSAPLCQPGGEGLETVEIAEGVFVHAGLIEEPDPDNRGDVSNLGFVIGAESVAVIDSGSARWIGEATWRAIRARTDKPVSHVILTHMHPDHVFGAPVFAEAGAEVVGHARLSRALADRQANYLDSLNRLIGVGPMLGTRMPTVTMPVDSGITLDLGGRVLTVTTWPLAHSPTDLTVYDATTGTLFAGDLLFHDHAPALDGSVLGWQAALTALRGLPAARVVPGHGAASLPWPKGAEALEHYLETLLADTRAAIAAGTRLGDAVQTIAAGEAPHWHLFDAYNPRNATVAFTELEWE